MIVTLPDSMQVQLEALARSEGLSSVDALMLFLVFESQAAALSGEPEHDEMFEEIPAPPEGASFAVNSHEELKAKLLEGLDSGPAILVTREFWHETRKALAERLTKRSVSFS